MKKLGIFLLIVVVFIAAVWFLTKSQFKDTTQSSRPSEVAGVSVEQQTINEEDATAKVIIDAQYPKINGLSDKQKQDQINERVAQIIHNQIDLFKKDISRSEGIYEQDMKNGLTIRYSVAQANDRIVSIAFPVSSYYLGAAHPNTVNITFNYDVRSSKELTLKDIFQSNSPYLQTLSELSREELKNQLQSDIPEIEDFINPGTEPKEENFQTFVLLPESLKLIFDPYQVAPYVAGTREVVIPFPKIQYLLNPTVIK